MKKRAVTYARVSGNDRAKTGGENLADQTRLCREHAIKRGYQIVADLAENDRGASGATFDLPQLSEALKMAHAGEYDVLIVRELDRLSRDLAKQLVVEQELKQASVTIEYVLYDFPDTPEGRLNKNLRAMLAEYEREKIKQRLLRGRKRKAMAGNVIPHGHTLYGYKVVEKDGKVMFEIEEKTARIVRLIFEWYTVGDGKHGPMSIRGITRALSALKVPTGSDLDKCTSCPKRVKSYGEWNTTSVARLLTNSAYIGLWHYGADNIPVEVPSIISKDTWEMAQRRKLQNKRQSRRNTKYDYLLRSRLKCGVCHYMLRVAVRKSRSGDSKRFYYLCQTTSRDLPCTNAHHYRADVVDRVTWEWIKQLLSEPGKLQEGLRKHKEHQDEATGPLRNRLEIIDRMIQEEQIKRQKILDVYTEGYVSKEEFVEHQHKYDQIIAGLLAQREEIQTLLSEQEFDERRIQTIIEFAYEIQDELTDAENDFAARQRLIELLDVTGELTYENGERVAYLHCVVGEKRVSIASPSTSTAAMGCTAPTGTTTLGRR